MKKALTIAGAWALPFVAFAQTINTVLQNVSNILAILLPIFITLAVLAFFWGLVKYLWGGAEDKDAAKNIMIWGVIALFVMVSVWGLVQLIGNTFSIQRGGGIELPQIPR